MNVEECKHIAILGYGEYCSDENGNIAYTVGKLLSTKGLVTCAGNIGGTFKRAFEGAKSVGGNTIAIVSKDMGTKAPSYCNKIVEVSDTKTKHATIAKLCAGAIVIGGGKGTEKVINQFSLLDKPVIAITGTGGIAERLDCQIGAEEPAIEEAIELIIKT